MPVTLTQAKGLAILIRSFATLRMTCFYYKGSVVILQRVGGYITKDGGLYYRGCMTVLPAPARMPVALTAGDTGKAMPVTLSAGEGSRYFE
jgi:hypothetical protein